MLHPLLAATTLGRGVVPVLPEDVRRLIWYHTFPRAILWCAACGIEVAVRLHDGERVLVNTHPVLWWEWWETPRCRWCVGYPFADYA